jgi:Tfp pilus assembly protein PilV
LRRKAGFTFGELLISMLIMLIVLALGVASLRHSRQNVESRALAQVIAEQLRLAREKAIATRSPVAVGFPSNGGSVPHTQTLYYAEGLSQPTINRTQVYASEYPNTCIMVAYWNLNTSALNDPTKTNTITSPQPLTSYDGFNLAAWSNGLPAGDPLLIFTPSGSVLSNGIPRFDDDYHVLITQGVSYSPAAAPPGNASSTPLPNYFIPTTVSEPYTITISSMGGIDVSAGVLAASTGSIQSPDMNIPMPAPGIAPGATAHAATTPQISVVTTTPTPDPNFVPAGYAGRVSTAGYLDLTVVATNLGGAPLYCTWSDSLGGSFSSPNGNRLQFDNNAQTWSGSWEWRPNPTATAGQVAILTCVVDDGYGHTAQSMVGSNGQILITQESEIVFDGTYNGVNGIYTINPDVGTVRQLLSTGPTAGGFAPRYSPDGTKIMYQRADQATGSGLPIYVMNADGTNPTQVTNDLNPGLSYYAWSGTSGAVDYISTGGNINSVNVDGSNLQSLFYLGAVWDVGWSPNGAMVTASLPLPCNDPQNCWKDGSHNTYVYYPSGGGLAAINKNSCGVEFAPDSSAIAYTGAAHNGHAEIFTMNTGGGNIQQWTNIGTNVQLFRQRNPWAPDASGIVFQDGAATMLALPDYGLVNLSGSIGGGTFGCWEPSGARLTLVKGNKLYVVDNSGANPHSVLGAGWTINSDHVSWTE